MSNVLLPEFPTDKEFEEFVAAFYQCGGLYIDRSIIDRGEEELFELDIIATDYKAAVSPHLRLIEIKSKGWGFSDIFKVRGWMEFLQIKDGEFVTLKANDHPEYCQNKANEIGVPLTSLGDWKNAPELFKNKLDLMGTQELDGNVWRFSYWIERKIGAAIKKRKKEHPGRLSYRAVDDYYFMVNSRTFLTPGALNRVNKLYDAFKMHPHIAACWAHEEQGGDFQGAHKDVPKSMFEATYYACKQTDLSLFTFVEHRSRIAIMKSAIDFAIYEKNGDAARAGNSVSFRFLGTSYKTLDFLP